MDDDQLMDYLTAKIETDVLTVAPHMNADRVLMVLTKYDKTVPYDSQLKLRDAMGNPEAITLPTGHNTAAAYLFYLRSRILKFFDRKLSEESRHGTAMIPDDVCDKAMEQSIVRLGLSVQKAASPTAVKRTSSSRWF